MKPLLVTLHLALVLVAALGLWQSAPESSPALARWIAVAVSYGWLLLFLPATWLVDRRLLTWFSFLLMFYFCWFVTLTLEPPPVRYWAIASTSVLVLLFAAIVAVLRKGHGRQHDR